jgi:hypothetical protein
MCQAKFRNCLQFTEDGLTTFAYPPPPPHSRRSRFFSVATRHNPKARVPILIGIFHAAHLTERFCEGGGDDLCCWKLQKPCRIPRGLTGVLLNCQLPSTPASGDTALVLNQTVITQITHSRARPTLYSQPMPFLSGRHC